MNGPTTGDELRRSVCEALIARREPTDRLRVICEVSRRHRVHSGLSVPTEWWVNIVSTTSEAHPMEGHAYGETEAEACGALWAKAAPAVTP